MPRDKNLPSSPLRQFDYRISVLGKILSPADFELLRITVEDLIFMRGMVQDCELDKPPILRAISTLLRRLLLDGDLNKAAKLIDWNERSTVKTRVLEYDDPNPLVIVSCGNCPWGEAIMPSIGSLLGSTTSKQREDMSYTYRDDVEMSLKQFLGSLAFVITGTKVKRSDVISYVANKKAAHVSSSRNRPAHRILDNAWQGLTMTRVANDGRAETMSAVYLELAGIAAAIGESTSINRFIVRAASCLQTAEPIVSSEMAAAISITLPIPPGDIQDREG